jgi:hypothetical protein
MCAEKISLVSMGGREESQADFSILLQLFTFGHFFSCNSSSIHGNVRWSVGRLVGRLVGRSVVTSFKMPKMLQRSN